MKEQLFTIPVNDAFAGDCECPLCSMYKQLEDDSITYTLGPSYMEEDNRALTDEQGFCKKHIVMLYEQNNRLGLALILKTHTDKTLADMKKLSVNPPKANGIFKKKGEKEIPLLTYIEKLQKSCFICGRMEHTFERFLATIIHLWKHDDSFPQKLTSCKGLCTQHFAMLYELGSTKLNGESMTQFLSAITSLYFANMERVAGDLEWFIDKFDYRNDKAPWKESKDALPRTIIKTNSHILP